MQLSSVYSVDDLIQLKKKLVWNEEDCTTYMLATQLITDVNEYRNPLVRAYIEAGLAHLPEAMSAFAMRDEKLADFAQSIYHYVLFRRGDEPQYSVTQEILDRVTADRTHSGAAATKGAFVLNSDNVSNPVNVGQLTPVNLDLAPSMHIVAEMLTGNPHWREAFEAKLMAAYRTYPILSKDKKGYPVSSANLSAIPSLTYRQINAHQALPFSRELGQLAKFLSQANLDPSRELGTFIKLLGNYKTAVLNNPHTRSLIADD